MEFSVFSTNDEHGWIFDWDFGQNSPRMYRGQPVAVRPRTCLDETRGTACRNAHSILVSAGDSIQGTLLSYYYNFIDQDELNPVTSCLL